MNDPRAIRDIEDNYPEYVNETLGYSYDVWDVVPTSVRREHDRIIHLDPAQLSAQTQATLPDVARWALARRLRQAGDVLGFLNIAQELAEKPEPAPGLNPHDIRLAGALAACEDAPERASTFIQALGEGSPVFGFLKAVQVLDTDPEEASRLFEEWCKEDPEAHFDVAKYLCDRGHLAKGRIWIARTRDVANHTQLKSVLVDVALLEDSLKHE